MKTLVHFIRRLILKRLFGAAGEYQGQHDKCVYEVGLFHNSCLIGLNYTSRQGIDN
jgi:hypothetical protein